MKLFEDLFQLQRIDNLIRTAATGSPKNLAQRLEISECSLYRLIAGLKDQGFPIEYDKERQSYYYTRNFKWNVEFIVKDEKILSMKGGENIFGQKKSPLSFFDSASPDLCNVMLQSRGYFH